MTRVPDGELAHNIWHPRHRVPPQRPLGAHHRTTPHTNKKGQPLIEVDLCAQDRTRSAVPWAQASADTLLAQTLRSSNEKLLSAQPTPPRVIYWAGAQSRCEALMTRVPDGELAHNIWHPRHRVPPQRPLWARQRTNTAHQQKKVNLLSKLTFVPRIGLEAQCHRHKLARIHY